MEVPYGILIYLHNALIIWFLKRQNTIESSSFGSEFVALRIAKELLMALQSKLRMFGMLIEGPCNVFCDSSGVVKNTSIPESTLMKKHNAIHYHAIREAVAAGIIWVGKERWVDELGQYIYQSSDVGPPKGIARVYSHSGAAP